MNNPSSTNIQLLDLLTGIWQGEGRGYFPGVMSFNYRETIIFTRHNPKVLAYETRSQKLYDGTTEWLESHWESGFIRTLESGDLEFTIAQIGRTEVLIGTVESQGAAFKIHFVSKSITNDPRMISSTRIFELEGDTLRYEMEMHTTKVEQSTPHVQISLQRFK